MEDAVAARPRALEATFVTLVEKGEVIASPEGAVTLLAKMNEATAAEDSTMGAKGAGKKPLAAQRCPDDPEFRAAIGHMAEVVTSELAAYPTWQRKTMGYLQEERGLAWQDEWVPEEGGDWAPPEEAL